MSWRSLLVVALLLLAGCSNGGSNRGGTYTFNPQQAPTKVDTAQLRAEKAAAGIQACPASDAGSVARPGGMPAVTLPCLGGGREVHLAGVKGPAVVNFWAQWCEQCRAESPILQQLHSASRGRVAVLGVDWQDPRPSYAIAFAKQLGLTYPQIADPTAVTRAPMHITGLPMTFFIDGSGAISYTQFGPVESAAQLAELVKQHLGVQVTLGEPR
ncbi:MAG: TlpA disulfide reductase family protein [Nocardioidaceae bacterium]